MKKILHFITTILHSAFHHCPHISSKGAFPRQMSTSFPRLSTQFTCWINLYLPPKKIISCRENIGASPPQKRFNFRRHFQAQILFHHFLSSCAFECSASTCWFKQMATWYADLTVNSCLLFSFQIRQSLEQLRLSGMAKISFLVLGAKKFHKPLIYSIAMCLYQWTQTPCK